MVRHLVLAQIWAFFDLDRSSCDLILLLATQASNTRIPLAASSASATASVCTATRDRYFLHLLTYAIVFDSLRGRIARMGGSISLIVSGTDCLVRLSFANSAVLLLFVASLISVGVVMCYRYRAAAPSAAPIADPLLRVRCLALVLFPG